MAVVRSGRVFAIAAGNRGLVKKHMLHISPLADIIIACFINVNKNNMDESEKMIDDLVHLARLALAGRQQDVQLFMRRMAKRYQSVSPELSEHLNRLLRELPTRSSPLRKSAVAAIPVDQDSRLQLIRWEEVKHLDVEPVFDPVTLEKLRQVVIERQNQDRLMRAQLSPTRSLLFTGAPGVGKTLAARWLARELKVPLLTLDLSAVMSSFLGRTGNNVRHVLDYAKGIHCILLLDELDAIAKRRDDATEVGELKRLVTVLLQEIDDWPADGLLIAATNHPDLLDLAVWRRFEIRVEFPMPDDAAVKAAVIRFLGPFATSLPAWVDVLALALRGLSFSEIEREIMLIRRAAALEEASNNDHLVAVVRRQLRHRSRTERADLAAELVRAGMVSQRQAHEITGVSRDTIRKSVRNGPVNQPDV